MSSQALSLLVNDLVTQVTDNLKNRLKAQQKSLVDRHGALLYNRSEVPPTHYCVGFILQNTYVTPYTANQLRELSPQYRVPIDSSLLTEALAWQRREIQYGNDAGILYQSLHALADSTGELIQYLPNVARALLRQPAQDEAALLSRLNSRQQRAFHTVQSKIVMFQADDLLS